MTKQDFRLIIRVLKKNPVVSVINIVGLAIGFTFVILASKFVYTEKTFDHFHANHKAISRVEFEMPEMPVICYSSGLMGQWAKSHIPEVKYATRVVNDQGFGGMQRSILYDNVKFKVENPLIVDDDFFQMFSFPVLAGNLKSFESDRYSVAITQKLSAKIFGPDNPLGKSISYKGSQFTVKALMADIPANSSIRFDMLLPISNFEGYGPEDWRNNCLQTFIQSDNHISVQDLQQKIHNGVIAELKALGYTKEASERRFLLNPLDRIYYSASLHDRVCTHGNALLTWIMFALAALVLLIALFNYANAALAGADENLKSVGIRSVAGASGKDNFIFVMLQTALPCVFSMLIAISLVFLSEKSMVSSLGIKLTRLDIAQSLLFLLGGGFVWRSDRRLSRG